MDLDSDPQALKEEQPSFGSTIFLPSDPDSHVLKLGYLERTVMKRVIILNSEAVSVIICPSAL